MKTIVIKSLVDDDFEKGYCYNCPFGYDIDYVSDEEHEINRHCILGKNYSDCPIIFEEEVKNE